MAMQSRLRYLEHCRRAYRRDPRAGDPFGTSELRPLRLRTAQDVMTLLEEQVGLVRAATHADTLEKARLLGYLAGVAVKVMETTNLAARIEMLESVLKARTEKGGS